MKKFILFLVASGIVLTSSAAKVTYTSNGVISYAETTKSGTVNINFQKCMVNNLFTFYTVSLDGKVVNSAATSDNIGPFNAGGTWMGGNHNTPQNGPKPSAYTVDVTATLDGSPLSDNGQSVEGSVLLIKVKNEIFYTDDKKFADEYMTYRVSGNSIEVWAEHEFQYPSPMLVNRYYGPQSMFPATELLLPGTKNKTWISLPGKKEIDVMKSEFSEFSTYVEKNANGYQAVLKYPDGIGDASCVSPSGEVYLFRNYGAATGKSYHVMMWDHTVKAGDKTNWHALYTWFNKPVEDTYRSGEGAPMFKYESYIDGESTVISLDDSGKAEENQAITELWKTEQVEAFSGNWEGKDVTNWDTPESVRSGSNTRFATVYNGKIYTVDQKTMSIAEVTKEGTLVPTYFLPKPTNASDYYGTAIAVDEAGNFLIGMNFTQRPTSSTKFAIYNTATKTCKEFNLDIPSGWTVGRVDCVGRVLGDLTKDAVFTIVPETGAYTSAVRVIGVKGDGTLESVTMTDLGNVSVAGNYTQQNIAQPVYRTMAEAKAADGVKDFYYSSCNGTNDYYASYIGGKVTNNFAPAMLQASIAGTNGFDTFEVDGKRYFVRNWAEKAGQRTMNIVVMDENGLPLAKWINYNYVLDSGYSSIVAEPLEDNTVNIYVFNSGVKFGAAAMLNFNPALAISGEVVVPEIPSGDGTESNPLIVSTPGQLANLSGSIIPGIDTYVELANDIDMDGVEFSAITTASTIHFDGKYHVISNLKVSGARASLFGEFRGSIKNLGIEYASTTASDQWGTAAPLVGYVSNGEALIENCFTSGETNGFYAGGIIAGVQSGAKATIRNCYSAADVTSLNGYAAGVAGPCNEGSTLVIENSYSAGAIKGQIYAAGISAGMNPAFKSASLTLNNVAVFCPSITGPTAKGVYIPYANLSATVSNGYVCDATLINNVASTESTAMDELITTVQSWEAFSDTELDEATGLPMLAWQADDKASVTEIVADDDAPAVYYNLQGVVIAKPEKGIYIVRRGNKVAKELVR